MEKKEQRKPRINGSLYIRITFESEGYLHRYKEIVDVDKKQIKYSLEDETTEKMSEDLENATLDETTVVRKTKTWVSPINREENLVALMEDLKTGRFSRNDLLNVFNSDEKALSISITERMVPSKRLFYFEKDNPYLLLELWDAFCRISDGFSKNVFPLFVERHTQKFRKKIPNEKDYREFVRALSVSENGKEDFAAASTMFEQNTVMGVFPSVYGCKGLLEEGKYILYDSANKNGLKFRLEDADNKASYCALLFQPTGLFDFLKEYQTCFNDEALEELSVFSKNTNLKSEDLPFEERAKIQSFYKEIGLFAVTYQLTDYGRIFEKGAKGGRFNPEGKHTIDLFYLLLSVARAAYQGYVPVLAVLDEMILCKTKSLISVHEAINRILSIQSEKKYYVVNDVLYCCYDYEAYLYREGKWITCDYMECIADRLYGFEASEPEGSPYRFGNGAATDDIAEISENNASNRFGTDTIIKTLDLF